MEQREKSLKGMRVMVVVLTLLFVVATVAAFEYRADAIRAERGLYQKTQLLAGLEKQVLSALAYVKYDEMAVPCKNLEGRSREQELCREGAMAKAKLAANGEWKRILSVLEK